MPWHPPGGLFAFPPPLILGTCVAAVASLADDLASAAILIVAEVLAVFGSAADVALDRHSRSRVLALAGERGKPYALNVERRLVHLPTYVMTARLVRFLGQALLVVGIAYVAFLDDLKWGIVDEGTPWGTFALVLLVLFLLTFLINDVLVRLLMARRPNRVLLACLPYLDGLRWLLAPLRVPLVLVVRLLFRVNLDAQAPSAREEILETVEEGEREGSFTAEEADMIESIIEMDSSLVRDVLTPRADLVMIQADANLDDAVAVVRENGYSRVPVYDRDRDDVVGVLYARDLLEHWNGPDTARRTVRELMHKPLFVPESKPLNDLLREMRARKMHLAVVLDEFNGTEGVVTIEDLLEEIVGEIEDEYDEAQEPGPSPAEVEAGTFEVEGRMAVEDLNEHLQFDLPIEDDFETVGGIVFHRLGKVPAPGDQVEIDDVRITVLEADERTVQRLRVEVITPPSARELPQPS